MGVLVDHYAGKTGIWLLSASGIQLGGCCVTIFILISAYLQGTKWKESGFKPIAINTSLRKRLKRILIPLWLTTLLIAPCEYAIYKSLDPTAIVCNLSGLCWVRRFEMGKHLWYITMVLLQYVFFILLSRLRLDKWKWSKWLLVTSPIALYYAVVLHKGLNHYVLAGPPLFLLLSAVLFGKKDYVLNKTKAHKYTIILLAITSTAISQYIHCKGLYEIQKTLCIISFIAAGFFLFLYLSCFMRSQKQRWIVTNLAGLSYEIFLVHDPLLTICNSICNNIIIVAIIWLPLTIIAAFLLKKTSKLIQSFETSHAAN